MNITDFLTCECGLDKGLVDLSQNAPLSSLYNEIDRIADFNQIKVLRAMQKNKLSDIHFAATTGYGYNDIGRDVLENIYADLFRAEAALVRPQIISGTHALALALFGNLRHGDELFSPLGAPYDTLAGVIGINATRGSLKECGVLYKQTDLTEKGAVDYDAVRQAVSDKTTLVTIQRSKGYAWRHSLTVEEIKTLISFVKGLKPGVICMVDNCYGEFVDYTEPFEAGADIVVGSLIKNPGGGIAPVGGYIVGKKEYVENAAVRLSAPGLGKEVGPTLGLTTPILQGLFLAPGVVAASLKAAVLTAYIFEKCGFPVNPAFDEKRADIVQAIKMGNAENIIAFCQGAQQAAPVDSFVLPTPSYMPGYDCPVIMASGSFVQGSSIEFSADAPIKEPFAVYMQGGLTWHHAKFAVLKAIDNLIKHGGLTI